MRSVAGATAAILVCYSVGCAMRPQRLTVGVLPAVQGEVSVRQIGGRHPIPAVEHCPVPCVLDIPMDEPAFKEVKYEVTVRAPGYFPATIEVPHVAAFNATMLPGGTLVVPLLPRKEPSK